MPRTKPRSLEKFVLQVDWPLGKAIVEVLVEIPWRSRVWLLALSLGVAESKRRVVRMIDEASAVRMLLRELSDDEWRWVQHGWIALDPEVDPALVLAMDAWAWIDRLPHSERTLRGWQSYWDENLRRGVERWRAEEHADNRGATSTSAPTPPPALAKRREPTHEERAALRERLLNKSTLHQL